MSDDASTYRARFRARFGAYDPRRTIKRSISESQVCVCCPGCLSTSTVWYPRVMPDDPPHTHWRRVMCPACSEVLVVPLSAEWLAFAELWRPWQHAHDHPEKYLTRPIPPKPLPEDQPPAVFPRLERDPDMSAPIAIYKLTSEIACAAMIRREYTDRTDFPFPGASDTVADLVIFWPEPGAERDALVRLHGFDAADLAVGEALVLHGVPLGTGRGRWERSTARTIAEARADIAEATAPLEALEAEDEPDTPADASSAPPEPAQTPEQARAEAEAWLLSQQAHAAPEPAPADDLTPTTEGEWVADEDTDEWAPVDLVIDADAEEVE